MIFIELRPHLVLPHFRGNDGFALRDYMRARRPAAASYHRPWPRKADALFFAISSTCPILVRSMIACPVLLGMTGLQNGTQPLQAEQLSASPANRTSTRTFFKVVGSMSMRTIRALGANWDTVTRCHQTGSNSQNDVSLSHGAVCREGPMHTEHTYPQRIITGKAPSPISVEQTGAKMVGQQCREFSAALHYDHATTSHDKRFSGGNEDVHRPPKRFRLARTWAKHRITTSSPNEFAACLLNVLECRQAQARVQNAPDRRPPDSLGQILIAFDQKVVFRTGAGDPCDIHFP